MQAPGSPPGQEHASSSGHLKTDSGDDTSEKKPNCNCGVVGPASAGLSTSPELA